MSGPPITSGTEVEAGTRERKAEHLRLARDERMQLATRPFDEWIFEHDALPGLALEETDPSVDFLGRRLEAPLLVSCMTGGTAEARTLNRRLAQVAEAGRVALGVGSQRAALDDPGLIATYDVRDVAPSVPILANLGAVQLNYGFGVSECRRAVEMIDADALVLHLNPLQEALQPEGQTDFRGLVGKMGEIARALDVPVVAKEVGMGISAKVARRLLEVGIRIVDVAGSGGTSWARIEAHRSGERSTGELFAGWGIPTPDAIREVGEVEGVTVIGSGGLRSGLDVAKAVALGSDVAGMAYPFLRTASRSVDEAHAFLERTVRELRIAMFCVGAGDLSDLRRTPPVRRSGSGVVRIL